MNTKLLHGKKALALLLSVLMVFTSLVFSANADDTDSTEPAAHEHTYELTNLIKKATCGENGEGFYTCTSCDEATEGHTKTDIIPATGEHNYEGKEVVASTCAKRGYTIKVCSVCKDTIFSDYTNALGHKYVSAEKAPTCTEEGGIVYTCSVCDEREPQHSYFVSKEAALNHDLSEFNFVRYDENSFARQAKCQRDDCDYSTFEMDEDGNVNIYYRVVFYNTYATDTTEYLPDGTVVPKDTKTEQLAYTFVLAGGTAEYEGETPIRDADKNYGEYEFIGWDKSLENVSANIEVNAVFEGKATQHWVKFFNANGKVLQDAIYVEHGGSVSYSGAIPTYAPDGFYNYTFSAWDKDTTAVYSDCSVIAVYTPEGKQYKVIYCDSDGSQLASEIFHYGDVPTKNPTDLKKEADNTFIYEFSGKWNYRYEAPSGDSTDWFSVNFPVDFLRAPSEPFCLDCNKGYASFEYDQANEDNNYMTDIEKGIIRVFADYYTLAKIYRVRLVVVDGDGDPIRNAGSVQVLNSQGFLAKTATLGSDASVILELTYDTMYTIQVSYMGEAGQQSITLDERNLGDNVPTVRLMLGSPSAIQEDKSDTCSCISHTPFIGRIYIAFLNIIYRLTGRKIVCCYDMYEKHGDQLVYTA